MKAEELRARAIGRELLGASFDELAERRALHEARMDAGALALRIIEAELPKEEHMGKPERISPTGLPFPQALQMATDLIARHYISPDIRQSPLIIAATLELSYLPSWPMAWRRRNRRLTQRNRIWPKSRAPL